MGNRLQKGQVEWLKLVSQLIMSNLGVLEIHLREIHSSPEKISTLAQAISLLATELIPTNNQEYQGPEKELADFELWLLDFFQELMNSDELLPLVNLEQIRASPPIMRSLASHIIKIASTEEPENPLRPEEGNCPPTGPVVGSEDKQFELF